MKNYLFVLLLSISSFLASGASEGASISEANKGLLFVNNQQNKAFLITSTGQLEQIFPPLLEFKSKKWAYLSQMMVSHGQQQIAYSKNNNLWLYDVVAKKESQLTNVGKPYTKKLASVEVSIKLWSNDDSKIMYSVMNGETEDPEGYSPTLNVRPADYGVFIYDLKTQRSTPLPSYIPGEFVVGWIETGDLILYFPSSGGYTNRAYQGQFVRYNLGNENATSVLSQQVVGSDFIQMDLSRDGSWITFTEYIWKSVPQKSRLQKFNLKTKELIPISPVGAFAEYQWPKMSPNGERAAYIHLKSGFYNCDLVVDDKAIYSFNGNGHFHWIDNTSLALFFNNPTKSQSTLMVVIDVETSVVKTEQEWKQ